MELLEFLGNFLEPLWGRLLIAAPLFFGACYGLVRLINSTLDMISKWRAYGSHKPPTPSLIQRATDEEIIKYSKPKLFSGNHKKDIFYTFLIMLILPMGMSRFILTQENDSNDYFGDGIHMARDNSLGIVSGGKEAETEARNRYIGYFTYRLKQKPVSIEEYQEVIEKLEFLIPLAGIDPKLKQSAIDAIRDSSPPRKEPEVDRDQNETGLDDRGVTHPTPSDSHK